MNRVYTAIIQQDATWWIGWVKEIPGVNSQAKTRGKLLANLKSALTEALEMNQSEALASTTGEYQEVILQV